MADRKAFKKLKINGLKTHTFNGESVRSYGKNAGKSAKYFAYDITKSMFPEITDLQYQTSSINADYQNSMSELKEFGSKYAEEAKKNFRQAKKAFKKQMKSGNWYKQATMGGFDIDDFDFGFDDDDYDSSSSSSNVVNAISSSIKMNKKMGSTKLSTLNAINTNMATMVEFNKSTISNWAEESAKYYADSIALLTEIRDSVKPKENTANYETPYTDFEKVTSGDFLNLEEYGKVMFKNINEIAAQTIGIDFDTISTLREAGSEMMGDEFQNMLSNPIGYVTKTFVQDVVLSKEFKESVERVRESTKDFTKSVIGKLSDWSDEFNMLDDGMNGFKGLLGNLFKIDKPREKNVNLMSYRKEGAVDFDSLTRKSIIEVIPGYLSKILTAVSSGSDDVLYDYEKGKFINRSKAKDEYDNDLKIATTSPFWKLANQFQDKFGGAVDEKEFNNMLYEMIDMGKMPLFNPDAQRTLMNKFTGDKDMAKKFLEFLESDEVKDSDRLSLNGKIYEALTNRKNFIKNKEANIEDITSQLFNFDDVNISTPTFGRRRRNNSGGSSDNNDRNNDSDSSNPSGDEAILNHLLRENFRGTNIDLNYIKSLVNGDTRKARELLKEFNDRTNSDQRLLNDSLRTVRNGIFGRVLSKTDEILDGIDKKIFQSAEGMLHDIIFGRRDRQRERDGNSFKERMNNLVTDLRNGFNNVFDDVKKFFRDLDFDRKLSAFSNKIGDSLINGLHKLSGERDVNGHFRGGKLSGVLNRGKDFVGKTIHNVTGREYIRRDGVVVEKSDIAPLQTLLDRTKIELFGVDYDKRFGMDKITGGGIFGNFISTTRKTFSRMTMELFGSQENIDTVKEKARKYLPSIGKGAGIGLVASMLLPGGPVMGAILGGAAGFANKSKAFNNLIFKDGTQDTLLKNTKEFFSKKFRDWNFNLRDATKFGIAGAMLMPGGPVLSGLAALGGAFAGGKHGDSIKDKFKQYLFGKGDMEKGRKRGLVHRLTDQISHAIVDPFKMFAIDQGTDIKNWFKNSVLLPVSRSMTMIGRDMFLTGKDIFKKAFSSIGAGIQKAFGTQINKFLAPLRFLGGNLFKAAKGTVKGLVSAPVRMLEALGNRSERRNLERGDEWTVEKSMKFADKRAKYAEDAATDRVRANDLISKIKENRNATFGDIEKDRFSNKKANEISKAIKDAIKADRTEDESSQLKGVVDKYSEEISNNDNALRDLKSNKKQEIAYLKQGLIKQGLSEKEASREAKRLFKAKVEQTRTSGNDAFARRGAELTALEKEFKNSRVQSVIERYGLDKNDPELEELKKSNTDVGRMFRKAMGLPEPEFDQKDVDKLDADSKTQEGIIQVSREQISKLEESIQKDQEQIDVINEQIEVEKKSISTLESLTARIDELLGKDELTDSEKEELTDSEGQVVKLGSITGHKNKLDELNKKLDETNKSKEDKKDNSSELKKQLARAKKEKDILEGKKQALESQTGRGFRIPFRPSNIIKPRKMFGRGEEETPNVSATKSVTGVNPVKESEKKKGEGGFEEGSLNEYNYKKSKEAEEQRGNQMLSTIGGIGKTVNEQFKWMKDQAQKASMWKMLKFMAKGIGKVVGFLGKGILGFLTKKFPILGKGISTIAGYFTKNKLTKGIGAAIGGALGGGAKAAIMKVKANKVMVGEGALGGLGDKLGDKIGDKLSNKLGGKVGGKLLGKASGAVGKVAGSAVGKKLLSSGIGKMATSVGGFAIKKLLPMAAKAIPVVGPILTALSIGSMAWDGIKAIRGMNGGDENGQQGGFLSRLFGGGNQPQQQQQPMIQQPPMQQPMMQPDMMGYSGMGRRKRRNNALLTGRGDSIASTAFNSVKSMGANLMTDMRQKQDNRIKSIKTFFELGTNVAEIRNIVKDIADLVGASANIQMTTSKHVIENSGNSGSSSSNGQPSGGSSSSTSTTTPKFNIFKPSTWKYIGRGNGFAYNNGRGEANGYAYYNQADPRWSDYSMDTGEGDTMYSAGCGPTTMAMALTSLGKKTTPDQAAQYALNKGYKVPNEGVDAGFISDYANANGLPYQARYVDNYAQNDIDVSLASGQPVIALGATGRGVRNGRGASPFTNEGHYVMITGKDRNGNYLVNDPLNASNNNRSFKPSELLGQTNSYWVDEGIDGSAYDVNGLYGRGTTFTHPLPTNPKITSDYGNRTHPISGQKKFHAGIDLGGSPSNGKPILASSDGKVIHSGPMGSYGNLVKIDHGNGYESRYAHASKLSVPNGATVKSGQEVAKVGTTGGSTGPHLHFEIRKDGNPVNPNSLINGQPAPNTSMPENTDPNAGTSMQQSSGGSGGNPLMTIISEAQNFLEASLFGKEYTPGGTNYSNGGASGGQSSGAAMGTGQVYNGSQAFAQLKGINTDKQRNFITKVQAGALDGRTKYGLLPSITIAQGIEESGWGTSGLARTANNLFGMKGSYNGQSTSNGWRKYPSWNESVEDHNRLLGTQSRYRGVIQAKDYKEAVNALNSSGYCEGNAYGGRIRAHIEQYGLDAYDKLGGSSSSSGDTQVASASTGRGNSLEELLLTGRGPEGGAGGDKVRMFDKVIQYARSFKDKLSYSMSDSRNAIDHDGLTSDCSTFTRHIFKTVAGQSIGDNTGQQIDAGQEVGIGNEQPGDLIFFKGTYNSPHKRGVSHVGIVTKKGTMIDIGSSPGPKERSYESSYWKPKQLTANRVLTNPNEMVDPTLPNANKKSGFVRATPSGEPDVNGGAAGGSTGGATGGQSSGGSSQNPLQYILGEASSMLTASLFGKEYTPGSMGGGTEGGSTGGASGYNLAGNDTVSLMLKDRANLSNKFEVGEQRLIDGTGPGFISSGQGDAGGRSYGLPQFTKGGSLQSFVRKLSSWNPEWAARLNRNPVGSSGFNAEWQKIGKENHEQFGKLQNQQASDTFYAPAAQLLRSNYNFDPDKRSLALQAEIHSTAVQYGSLNKIMKSNQMAGKNYSSMSDTQFTDALLDAKLASVGTTHFRGCSGSVQNGVRSRFNQEKALVKQMYEKEQTLKGGGGNNGGTPMTGRGNRRNNVIQFTGRGVQQGAFKSLSGRGANPERVANKAPIAVKSVKTISNVKAMADSTSLQLSQIITLLTEIRDSNQEVASNTSVIADKDFTVEMTTKGTINNSYKDGDLKVNSNTDITNDTNPFLSLGGQSQQANVSSGYDSMRDSVMKIAQGL